ncbi:MAG: CvpA family protein [Clostridia bacterium]|nr:CvpA family protein [Clostridia bacterium]
MDFLPIVFDAIMILIFVSCIFDGRRKGFVKMILSVVAAIVCFIVAKEFCEPVAVWLNDNFVHSALVSAIADVIENNLSEGTQAVLAAMPSTLTDALAQLGFSVENAVSGLGSQENVSQAAESITNAAQGVLVLPLLNIISFIVIFAVCRFVSGFAVGAVNTFFRLPVINGINKFAGGFLGAVKGFIVIAVVSFVALGVARILPDMPLAEAIKDSTVITTLAEITTEFIQEA